MKKYYVLTSLLILPILIFSQTKFGNATKEELEMTSYEKDTTAAAVVLKKSGNMRFIVGSHGGFQLEYTEEKKIKILKAEALDPNSSNNVVDNKINYYVRSRKAQEDIKTLSGTTYNLEGGKIIKTKLSKENIFDEDLDEKDRRRKFTMPAAKVGSVVEYKYTIVSDFYYSLKDFYFQESIPVAEVDLEVIIPEYFKYNFNNQGYIRMDESKQIPINEKFYIKLDGGTSRGASGQIDCQATKYIFKVNDVPAAKNERFIWAIDDYISKISFELRSTHFPWSYDKPVTSTWENIDKELIEESAFGGNLKQTGLFKKEIEPGEITLERATEIVEQIKGRMKWNEYNSAFTSKLKKALEEGVGNNAEINFLLINALKPEGLMHFLFF